MADNPFTPQSNPFTPEQNPFTPEAPSVLKDIPTQVVGGVRDAVESFYKLAGKAGNYVVGLVGEKPKGSWAPPVDGDYLQPEIFNGAPLPEVRRAETLAGGLTRGITQFGVGMVPGMHAAKIAKIGQGATMLTQTLGASEKFSKAFGLFASTEVAAQIADQVAFDPFLPRLSNMIEDFPALSNPVTEYLSADPNDTEASNRFKIAIEGLGLGAISTGIISGVGRMRGRLHSPVKKPVLVTPKKVPPRPTIILDTNVGKALREKSPNSVVTAAPEPFVRGEIPEKYAGNINLQRIDSPDAVKRSIAATTERYAGQLDEARRGVISEAQTKALADDLGLSVDELMSRKKGEAFNAERVLATRELMQATATDLAAKAKSAVGGSSEQLLEFRQSLARHQAVQEQASGVAAEAGRALRAYRINVKGNARLKAIENALDEAGGREGTEKLAQMLASADTREGLMRAAREMGTARAGDKFWEVYFNFLLSGPQTQAVNAAGNTVTAFWSMPEHMLAAGIGKVTRSADARSMRGVVSRAYGMVEGVKDGLRVFAKSMITEDPIDMIGKIELPRQRAIGGLKGRLIRLPGTTLQATDGFFKAVGYRMELRQLAMDDGLAKGLRGNSLAQHVGDFLAKPTQEFDLKALDNARHQTYTNPLGPTGQAFIRFKQRHPLLNLLAPFVRTPVNIVKYALGRSPFGVFMKSVKADLKAGGAARDLALSRMSLGTAVSAVAMTYAADGVITGGGPRDRISRAALRATGWQPYSIKFNGKYYSYARLEPFGILFGLAADAAETWNNLGEDDANETAARIVASVSNNLSNKTFLRAISEFVEMMSDPIRYGDQYFQNFIGMLVPTGVAQHARTVDPVMRDTQSYMDKLKSRTVYSKDLPMRVDLWGEPIGYELTGNKAVDLINPIYMSTQTTDKTKLEFQRLNVRRGRPGRTIKGLKLTPEEYYEYSAASGKLAKYMMDVATGGSGWESLPDDIKRKTFERFIDEARQEYGAKLTRARKLTGKDIPVTLPFE